MAIRQRYGASVEAKMQQLWTIVKASWHLGVTAFGGPPVHFKIFRDKYVTKLRWIPETMNLELFSICQATPGPASTKMLYCINLMRGGLLGAVIGFLIWSLPGAFGMFGLSIGVANIGSTLPRQAYALLSGLNSATVGIILLAAVELSEKAITDDITRLVVFLVAAAGLLYNALWYFPVLMVFSGAATIIHDYRWLHGPVKKVKSLFQRKKEEPQVPNPGQEERNVALEDRASNPSLREPEGTTQTPQSGLPILENSQPVEEERTIPDERRFDFSWKVGAAIIVVFFLIFIAIMVLRAVLVHPPILFRLFANMVLAGTIIFGGGPVVIPLLREYVVAEGWVSPRDFLIGLAVIQAFPGPNFNFAVFLGSLTAANAGSSTAGGAVLGFIGIFVPGLVLVHGTMGLWNAIRNKRYVKSVLRGMNAGGVGLIYTAVYRLFLIGYIDEGFQSGRSLGDDPWWVVVTAVSYGGGRWWKLSPPFAIMLGGILGLIRYAVVTRAGA